MTTEESISKLLKHKVTRKAIFLRLTEYYKDLIKEIEKPDSDVIALLHNYQFTTCSYFEEVKGRYKHKLEQLKAKKGANAKAYLKANIASTEQLYSRVYQHGDYRKLGYDWFFDGICCSVHDFIFDHDTLTGRGGAYREVVNFDLTETDTVIIDGEGLVNSSTKLEDDTAKLITLLQDYLTNYTLVMTGYCDAYSLDLMRKEIEQKQVAEEVEAMLPQLPDNVADGKTKITIPAYALMHVYLEMFNGQSITKQNGDSLASKYGYKSGAQLRNDFLRYQEAANRRCLHTENKKSAKTHLKRFADILPLLHMENIDAYNEAKRDLEVVINTYNKHYNS